MRGMLVAAGAVVLALTFSVSSGAATAWDQAKVTDLARQVAKATVELREIVEKNPDRPPGAARKAQYSAREDLPPPRLRNQTSGDAARGRRWARRDRGPLQARGEPATRR